MPSFRSIVALIAFGLIGLWAYGPGLTGLPFADDFELVLSHPSDWWLRHFHERYPYNGMYRPIKVGLVALAQSATTSWPVVLHGFTLLLHFAVCGVVYRALRGLRFTSVQAGLAALYLLICQAAAMAVLNLDTFDQVGSVLLGITGLWLLARALEATPFDRIRYGMSVICLVLALFTKETAAAFVPMFGLVLIASIWRGRSWRTVLALGVPVIAVFAIYLFVRSSVAPNQVQLGGVGPYAMNLGLHIPQNLLMFAYAALTPVSSVWTFQQAATGGGLALVPAVAVTGLLAVLIGVGLWRSKRPEVVEVLIFCTIGACFPMALFQNISELYVYNALPFVAALFGIGIGRLVADRRSRSRWVIWSMLGLIWGLLNLNAVRDKAEHIIRNGDRAATLVEAVVPYIDEVPTSGSLVLVNPPSDPPRYSIFSMSPFGLVEDGHILHKRTGRTDVVIQILDADTLQPRGDVILTIRADTIVRFYSDRFQ